MSHKLLFGGRMKTFVWEMVRVIPVPVRPFLKRQHAGLVNMQQLVPASRRYPFHITYGTAKRRMEDPQVYGRGTLRICRRHKSVVLAAISRPERLNALNDDGRLGNPVLRQF